MNLSFLKQALLHPRSITISTSHKACKLMVELAEVATSSTIVELGAGHGKLTRHILSAMKQNAKLYAIEQNLTLAENLLKIQDNRLTTLIDNALHTSKNLQNLGKNQADCILSTLPLRTLEEKISKTILSDIKKYMTGTFVQIQYSRAREQWLYEHFKNVTRYKLWLNFLPANIYVCKN